MEFQVKRLFLIVLLILPGIADAQKDSLRSHYAGFGYFSEGGFYPGFTFNYEKKLMSNQSFQLLLGGKAGAYFHSGNHTGIFLMVQSGQRFRLSQKFYFEHYLGIGYLHSFLNGGDAYYVNASGQVQTANDWGNPHFMPSVNFGVSYHVDQGKRPMIFYFRPMIFWQIPFNETSLVQYAFELGVMFKLN